MSFGQIDWRGVLQSVSKRDYLRYICYLGEKGMTEMKKCSERIKKPVCNSTFIIDLEGLSMRQMGYKPCKLYFSILISREENKIIKHSKFKVGEIGLETVRMLEANYPENLSKAIIINGRLTYYAIIIVLLCNTL
jgi:hypothetical protein